MSLQHPTWSYNRISEETGIKVGTIYDWARKYHYKERKEAKLEYEAKLLDEIQLESKIHCAKKNALRNMIDEDLLDAYAEFNQKLVSWLDVEVITEDVLKKQRIVNKHLNEYLDLRNKHLQNTISTEELIKTLENKGDDIDDEELRGLAGALNRSRLKIMGEIK